ncbi:hypothetical protein KAU37_11135 [Candidatus Bipolaricaulota bacterium]|nr:hypothetical protein [Candidatus Bipolaricaulota bacterium]
MSSIRNVRLQGWAETIAAENLAGRSPFNVEDNPLNVGGKLRRYEEMAVAAHLVCDVTLGVIKQYIKLHHEDQLRLDL